ncbi:protein of unknown function [Taphrina deformans PYCC 5710]|uniref:Delta(14)-sterol reductase n=1 Tax=Taphrina deformans (strain PYCC 5710 / ATCC 11124 / CBS 356.35 / IMI 108563 / JCM 9778 / NBRC 8474) TaxID=1097556 RepID=R4XPE9_TAPDE|nr:protein of unknown function [Taphrina deformans PYCC 5710]|eukprot:CCG85106.1 protein of unknown function [Taphrina deformans PYCC 5710]
MSSKGTDYRVNAAANASPASPSVKKSHADLNPKTTHYEFLGPYGALAVTVGTPLTTYFLYFFVSPSDAPVFSVTALTIYFNWFTLLVFLWYILPGKVVQGTELRNGDRLTYKMNGLQSLAVVLVLVSAGLALDPTFLEPLVTYFLPLITASLIVSVSLAAWSYYVSCNRNELLAEGGNSGAFVYDFFIGRALNPRVGSFDVKVFCELRPGLFLWLLLDLAFLIHQYLTLHRVTDSMVLVVAFQGWYVVDSVWNESAVLSTMDVTTDGFGFMLAFGDLTWVPFTYSLQARYLASHPVDLGLLSFVVLAIQFLGYHIFRSANSQKDRFRNDPGHPSVRDLRSIATSRGTKLLADGWWGSARHINYFGDWIMAWAWCLPTASGNPLTYFYVVYFGVLLLHRERRDEEKCAKKYGDDWVAYKKVVPWRIIPYIY